MTATRPGGIPPHRHVHFLVFSAPLMDCSCRELALCAQTVRREQSLCSKNLRKFLQMPGQWYPSQGSAGHAGNSFVFLHFAVFSCLTVNHTKSEFGACGLFAHVAPVKMAIATHVEQTICTCSLPSEIKVQVCPLVPADLWQIFAGLASRAIALKTLFERRARVCLKSNL